MLTTTIMTKLRVEVVDSGADDGYSGGLRHAGHVADSLRDDAGMMITAAAHV